MTFEKKNLSNIYPEKLEMEPAGIREQYLSKIWILQKEAVEEKIMLKLMTADRLLKCLEDNEPLSKEDLAWYCTQKEFGVTEFELSPDYFARSEAMLKKLEVKDFVFEDDARIRREILARYLAQHPDKSFAAKRVVSCLESENEMIFFAILFVGYKFLG